MPTVPGSNLLRRASRLIGQQTIQYYVYQERVLNSIGQWVSGYASPIPISCSVQAVNRASYTQLGLDLQKNYVNIFAPLDVIDLDRDSSGDQFVNPDDNGLYQLESENGWYKRDGWAEALAVRVALNQLPNVITP